MGWFGKRKQDLFFLGLNIATEEVFSNDENNYVVDNYLLCIKRSFSLQGSPVSQLFVRAHN